MQKNRGKRPKKNRQKQAVSLLTHAADSARFGYYLSKIFDWLANLPG
jgi:hypothetical protein